MKPPFLAQFERRERKLVLIEKSFSPLMRLINVLLTIGNKLGLCNIENFLGGYGTTLSNRIYDSPAWTEDTEPSPHVVHELTHVLLWSFVYVFRYVFSAKWRLKYEADCIQTTMLCFPDKRSERYVITMAKKLTAYGIKEEEAQAELALRLNQVCSADKAICPESKRVYRVVTEWNSYV